MAGNQVAVDRDILIAAAESSYGTDPTPTEGVDLRGDMTTSVDRQLIERARVWAQQGGVAHGVIDDAISFSFQVAVGGVEDADDGVPGIHPFLIGAGFEVATSGTEAGSDVKAVYTLKETGKGSWAGHRTLVDETTGNKIRLKLLGCRNNIEIVSAMNGELLANISGMALYAEWEAAASISDPTSYGYSRPSIMSQNVTHTLGGSTRYIKNWSFNTNWQVGRDDAINGAANIREVLIHRDGGSNRPGGSFDPIMLSSDFAASSSHVAAAREGTEQAYNFTCDDGSFSFEFDAAQVQIDPNLGFQKDGAVRRFNTPYYCNTGSGTEATITFDSL